MASAAKRLEDEFRVMQSKFNEDVAKLLRERSDL